MVEICVRKTRKAVHYEALQNTQLIEEILDDRYNELRDLVHHLFSFYVQLVSEIAKAVKKDRKAHLSLRLMKSLNSYLDSSSIQRYAMQCSTIWQMNIHRLIEYDSSGHRYFGFPSL